MLLAIDTSAGTDVAIVTPHGRVLGELRSADTRHHAEAVGDAIETVLAEAGLSPQHITQVIGGMGPGPFTGLRVGVAAARTFAFARGARFIPMPSHDAAAHEWRAAHPEANGDLLVSTDARRGELACSRYERGLLVASSCELHRPDAVPGAAHHFDTRTISAAHLALAWLDREAQGLEAELNSIVYLRGADAVPSNGPKRVTG
ncbi:tRNA (adenosine(37)-N6)-threonylcarbamoyltransferase complex dimerization subunit type 1 TsaB [Pseudoclavibacter sp. RFBA6]|uniref:tRNA (adenosine(37)-N6)-threonylcarbamoyltransferase complex dimerization subunit type 1 TsaB n=1 Tax=Pseudoclavibacter sp. RFBA6 TaxID=2080573 RepID=UPI000CE77E82|nr:tRNA (adenosine(37)-N6)-threonylcarbamoyltransferase complex dimerization subunit type 1 TsaB [Pseudoclavibacter sp. RFBA6]PPG38802.1 tRNA (adenosine(37)-N6)-threonylcarbamoyltransferase complex dimerization subunit type 1 TsaB [Pseudoclavibacter sp. RFBA6]